MRRGLRVTIGLVFVTSTLGLLFACTGSDPEPVDLGTSSSSSSSSGATSTSSSSSSGSTPSEAGVSDGGRTTCPEECLPKAPDGWKGPSAVQEVENGAAFAACSGFYPNDQASGYQYDLAVTASCACGPCTLLEQPSCSIMLSAFGGSSGGCPGAPIKVEKPVGCHSLSNYGSGYKVTESLATGGKSGPAALTTGPRPNAKRRGMHACGQAQIAGCGDRAECVAAPKLPASFQRLCVHKEGDVTCPADYPEKEVVFGKADDSRACGECITKAGGLCPTPHARGGNSCDGADLGERKKDDCHNDGVQSGLEVKPPVSGTTSCNAKAVYAGEVKPQAPVTFCCNK